MTNSIFTSVDLDNLIIFEARLKSLSKFSRPLYKKLSWKISIHPVSRIKRQKGVPSDLRTAAIVNELRSFVLLEKDPAFFRKIQRIVKKYHAGNRAVQQEVKEWLQNWELQLDSVLVMKFGLKDGMIDSYRKLLDLVTYGEYNHNDLGKFKNIVYLRKNLWADMQIRSSIRSIAVFADRFLRSFDKKFVKPIIEKELLAAKMKLEKSLQKKPGVDNK
jgi:hypothetical protein